MHSEINFVGAAAEELVFKGDPTASPSGGVRSCVRQALHGC
jgi:hypothetical protein